MRAPPRLLTWVCKVSRGSPWAVLEVLPAGVMTASVCRTHAMANPWVSGVCARFCGAAGRLRRGRCCVTKTLSFCVPGDGEGDAGPIGAAFGSTRPAKPAAFCNHLPQGCCRSAMRSTSHDELAIKPESRCPSRAGYILRPKCRASASHLLQSCRTEPPDIRDRPQPPLRRRGTSALDSQGTDGCPVEPKENDDVPTFRTRPGSLHA